MNDAFGSASDGHADRASYSYTGGSDRGRGGGRHGRGSYHSSNNNPRHYTPYNTNNRGRGAGRRGRGPRPPGNRFQNSTSVDAQTAMERQLSAMVSRVGELKAAPEGFEGKRPIVQVMTKNIQDLVSVLTGGTNAALFLKFGADTPVNTDTTMDDSAQVTPMDQAGSLVRLIISCVCTLPLQTACYAAITMAVDENSPIEYKGFATRCLKYACLHLARDLDSMLLETDTNVSMCMNRAQHVLKYFAILSKIGVVCPYDQVDDPTRTSELTMAALLKVLTTASIKMVELNPSLAALLAHLVLNTIPYMLDCLPSHFIVDHFIEPLELNVLSSERYKSTFTPGVGKSALLLKSEQQEDNDDEEDDDEEDDDEAANQCCDTLQDLLRAIKRLMAEGMNSTRFALFTDAPWAGLTKQAVFYMEEGDEDSPSPEVLTFSSEPLRLSLTAESILAIFNDIGVDLQCFSVEGVIFGRLPILGSPTEDDEEDEQDMETTCNQSLQAYQKGYGLVDRYFLSDAIRDVLLSHQISVSDTGLDRGTTRNTAEQCWSVRHVMLPNVDGEEDCVGIEYPIVEAILSLILQSTDSGTLRHIYLCRVLVELIRLKPDLMPQALAIGVSNLVQFYLPSLGPLARDNFSRWFAFHMTNLDYQWPPAFWGQWAAFMGKRSSRSDFLSRSLTLMAENLSSASILVKDCLPAGSPLARCLLGTTGDEGASGVFASLGLDIRDRIWENSEDADRLQAYILSEEVSASVADQCTFDDDDAIFWRTNAVIHGLLHAAERYQAETKEAIAIAIDSQGDVVEPGDGSDVYCTTMEKLRTYKTALSAVLAKDMEAHNERLLLRGEKRPVEFVVPAQLYLLRQVRTILPNSRTTMQGCINFLVENELVEVQSVFRFALDTQKSVVERWWEIASSAFRLGLDKAVANVDANIGNLFVIDVHDANDDSAAYKRATPIIAYVEPLVELMVELVSNLLSSKADGVLSKKLTPEEVDLVEGLKLWMLTALSTLMIRLKARGEEGVKGVSESKARALLEESSIARSKLASRCMDKGRTLALGILAKILERI